MTSAWTPCRACGRPLPAGARACADCGVPVATAPADPAIGTPDAPASEPSWAPPARVPGSAAPPPGPDRPGPQPGKAPLFADLPLDVPDSLAEWLVAIGSVVSVLSFLLPWVHGTVTYVDSWGLSSISRLPILIVLVTTAFLAIVPNRVANWVRLGLLGLIGGSVLFGLLWPYVAGDFSAEFGAVVGASAALVLIVGGIVGVAPRKVAGDRS